jgi:hypothetical protein
MRLLNDKDSRAIWKDKNADGLTLGLMVVILVTAIISALDIVRRNEDVIARLLIFETVHILLQHKQI